MNKDRIADWLKSELGSDVSIRTVTPLDGGTSSKIDSLETADGMKMVLRRFTNNDWLLEEPDLAIHEAESLRCAAALDVAAPRLIAMDPTEEACGHPAILMSYLEGKVVLHPARWDLWHHRLAEAIFCVHRSELSMPWRYFTYNDVNALERPDWSAVPDLWGKALDIVRSPRPETRTVFIHRDYHPVNVLWKDGAVSGIVDWVNACMGPAGIDVGHCRLNLALLHGMESADLFLKSYESIAGTRFAYHPYWDLLALIECLPGPPAVYEGWLAFGANHLNDALMRERIDEYLISLMNRFLD